MAEREFGIQPVTTGQEMAAQAEPDKLLMVLYLSRFYEAFRNSPVNSNGQGPFKSLLVSAKKLFTTDLIVKTNQTEKRWKKLIFP